MRAILLPALVIGLVLGLGGPAYAQEEPAPCGPAGGLAAEFAKNVAPDSRCFEIRMYTAEPAKDGVGGIDVLHRRFRDGEVELFEKHGAVIVGTWQSLDNPNTLIWMLAYRDRAHREEVFANFLADPDWKELLAKNQAPLDAEVFMMSASDYSNMK